MALELEVPFLIKNGLEQEIGVGFKNKLDSLLKSIKIRLRAGEK